MTIRQVSSLLLASLLVSSACVSTHMKKFIGRDVRYIEISDGAPVKVFDLPDGQRAFQYLWGGGRYVVPQTTTTQGQVQLVGGQAYYSELKVESGGLVVDSSGCLITYITKWSAERKGWIVETVSYPKRPVC